MKKNSVFAYICRRLSKTHSLMQEVLLEVSSDEEDTTTNTMEIPVEVMNARFFNLSGVKLDGLLFCSFLSLLMSW